MFGNSAGMFRKVRGSGVLQFKHSEGSKSQKGQRFISSECSKVQKLGGSEAQMFRVRKFTTSGVQSSEVQTLRVRDPEV